MSATGALRRTGVTLCALTYHEWCSHVYSISQRLDPPLKQNEVQRGRALLRAWVDHQLELTRLLDRQIAGLPALEIVT